MIESLWRAWILIRYYRIDCWSNESSFTDGDEKFANQLQALRRNSDLSIGIHIAKKKNLELDLYRRATYELCIVILK